MTNMHEKHACTSPISACHVGLHKVNYPTPGQMGVNPLWTKPYYWCTFQNVVQEIKHSIFNNPVLVLDFAQQPAI